MPRARFEDPDPDYGVMVLESLMANLGSTAPQSQLEPEPEPFVIDWQGLEYVGDINENLLCPICKTPFHDPLTTTTCDHTFCKTCLEQSIAAAGAPRAACPMCRAALPSEPLRTLPCPRYSIALLDDLVVKCPNEACKWTGARGAVENHLENICDYTLQPCPDADCNEKTTRKNIHMGCVHYIGSCPYCDGDISMLTLDQHDSLGCRGSRLSCEYCNAMVLSTDKATHEETCSQVDATCAYASEGCRFISSRSFLAPHEATCSHGLRARVEAQAKEITKLKQCLGLLQHRQQQAEQREEERTGELRRLMQEEVARCVSNVEVLAATARILDSREAAAGDTATSLSQTQARTNHSDDELRFDLDPRQQAQNPPFGNILNPEQAQAQLIRFRDESLLDAVEKRQADHEARLFHEIMAIKEQMGQMRSGLGEQFNWLVNLQRQVRASGRQNIGGGGADAASDVDSDVASSSSSDRGAAQPGSSSEGRVPTWGRRDLRL